MGSVPCAHADVYLLCCLLGHTDHQHPIACLRAGILGRDGRGETDHPFERPVVDFEEVVRGRLKTGHLTAGASHGQRLGLNYHVELLSVDAGQLHTGDHHVVGFEDVYQRMPFPWSELHHGALLPLEVIDVAVDLALEVAVERLEPNLHDILQLSVGRSCRVTAVSVPAT